uniref:Uncharacterized protein n=1 Tax=viral metagenome TaxID=1070528 RepID=A0A6M3XXV1_9ZZZZ
MEYKRYRDDVTIEGDTAIETLEAREVPEEYVLEVTHMMIADVTTVGQTLEVGYISPAGDYKVLGATSEALGFEYQLIGHAWLMAGEKPYGRVTTSVDGDDIHFSVHGKLWKIE